MTLLVFSIVFFLIFFAVYFFRPKKDDKIIPMILEKELMDPEEISLPHRAEPDWPAILERENGETGEVRIVSLTHGSAFLKSATGLPIGEKFQITIQLPDRSPIQLKAEVTWSNLHLPADKVVKPGMGIRFVETGADAVCLINDTIARHGADLNYSESQKKD